MGWWNLKEFEDIFWSMAESANTGRSNSFVLEELTEFQREKLKNGESVKFNFSKDVKKENKVIEGGHTQVIG